jgi:hypothetical protein
MEDLRTSYQLLRPLLQQVLDAPAVSTTDLQTTLDTRTTERDALRAELDTRTAERDASDTLARENQVRLDTLNATIGRLPGNTTNPRREKMSDPPKYSGDRAALRPFLAHLHLKLTGDHDLFPDEPKRLAYSVGRLEGKAFDHILPFITSTGISLDNVQALSNLLEAAFGDPDRVGTAERKLDTLKQNNRDFATYYSEFARIIADLDWNTGAQRNALRRGLN